MAPQEQAAGMLNSPIIRLADKQRVYADGFHDHITLAATQHEDSVRLALTVEQARELAEQLLAAAYFVESFQ